MKKFLVSVLFLVALVVYLPLNSANAMVSGKSGMMSSHRTMQHRMTARKAKLIAYGKKLFYSRSIIGSNGFSCATCHVYSADTYIKMHGKGMVIMTVKNAKKKLAAMNRMNHTHMTLVQRVKMCDRMALKGQGLRGRKLKALVAYIKSL
ncbi:MAG: cytochrome c peroxidase [bacterium]